MCSTVPRAPNRSAHERLLEETTERLTHLEERRRFLQDRIKGMKDELAKFRTDREAINEDRNRVDNQLSAINKDVNTRSEQVQKLRSSIPYLSEDRIDEQIKTLEDLMMKHHYKRSEENKIILEVNRLKRSKKSLKDHNKLKTELERLRKEQRQIRERRDQLFRQRGDFKKKEDTIKRDSNEIKKEFDKIKIEIEEILSLRKAAINEFKVQDNEYKKYLYERRQEQRVKRKEEREEREAEKQKEIEEIKANAEPYDEEIKLLSNLITYCLRFEFPNNSVNNSNMNLSDNMVINNGFLSVPGTYTPRRGSHESGLRRDSDLDGGGSGSSVYATPIGTTPISTPISDREGGFVYKKDDVEETLFAGVGKKTSRRNSRNERRNSKSKPLTHNPEIFGQFSQFKLTPPASNKEVETVVSALKDKLISFETLAMEEKERRDSQQQPNITVRTPPNHLNITPVFTPPDVFVSQADELNEERAMTIHEEDENNLVEEEDAFPSLPDRTSNGAAGFFGDKDGKAKEMQIGKQHLITSQDL